MDDELRHWVESVAGGPIESMTRGYGGGSREMYFVDVVGGGSYVLRVELGTGALSGTELSLAREASVYRSLQGTDVPVARLHGVTDDGSALLMAKVAGSDDLSGLSDGELGSVLDDFMASLAKLHNCDVASLPLEGLARPASPEDHARLDLDMWARLAGEKVSDLDPLSVYAMAWAHVHAPRSVQRTVLVHGDSGPGNFLALNGRVSALVDWEFAHIGDPMDDFAWIDMRGNSRGIPVTDYYDTYFKATGLEFDGDAVLYHRVGVYLKCAIITAMAVEQGGGAQGFAPYLIANTRYQLLTARALTDAMGLDPVTVELPAGEATERTALFDRAMTDLRAVRSAAPTEELKRTVNSVVGLMHHFRAADRLAHELDEADRADAAAVLGATLDADALRAVAAEAGAGGDVAVLQYLIRHATRRSALWGTAIAQNPIPEPPALYSPASS